MSGLPNHARLETRRQEERHKKRRAKVWCPGCGGKVKPEQITAAGVCTLCTELRRRREQWAERIALLQERMAAKTPKRVVLR